MLNKRLYNKRWRRRNPDKARQYGLTWRASHRKQHNEYQRKWHNKTRHQRRLDGLKKQRGKCAICGSKKPGGAGIWSADHDHVTKQWRGILCVRCNLGLGYFKDSTKLLDKAIRYLNKYQWRLI